MTNTTDPRNVYLNPKGVPALIAGFEPMIDEPLTRTPQPRAASASLRSVRPDPMPETTAKLAERFRSNRVDPELEARVPAGRYAVVTPLGTKFYRIDKPVKGSWKGWTFVKVQASDDLYPVRSVAQRTQVLEAIAADVLGASQRYGRELGVCGVCGRTLTDPDSRARGIGPVCESKF
jgi:hypothetical protein